MSHIKFQARKNWADPVTRRKMLRHLKTFSRTPEQRANNSLRTKALWADPDYREKMRVAHEAAYPSERMRAMRKNVTPWNKGKTKLTDLRVQRISSHLSAAGISPWNNRATWYATRKRAVRMHSRWEVTFALFMDFLDIKWEYEKHRFYVGDGPWAGKRYIPDFYLPEQDRFIEVKGHFPEWQRRKFAAFRTAHPKVRVSIIYLKDLVRLGLVSLQGRVVRCR